MPALEKDTGSLSTCLTGSLSLSPHLPHAGSAAENSDCTVVIRRATLTGRYNKASLFPRESEVERHIDRRGTGSAGRGELSFTLLPS